MRKRLLWKIGLCLLLSKIPNLAAMNGNNFSLEILPMKSTLIIGEPLIVKGKFFNHSDVELEFLPPEIMFFISRDGINFKRYRSSWICKERVLLKILPKIGPGEIKETNNLILYDVETDNLVFPSAGTYFIRGKDSYYKITTNTIQIEINRPQGVDLDIWEFIKKFSSEYSYFVQHAHIRLSREKRSFFLRQLQQIIETYPTSTYTPYIKEALIKYYRTKPDKTPEEKEYLKTLQKNKDADKK